MMHEICIHIAWFTHLMHKTNTCNLNSDDANQKGQAQKIFVEHFCLDQPYSKMLYKFDLLFIYIYSFQNWSSLFMHECILMRSVKRVRYHLQDTVVRYAEITISSCYSDDNN